MSYYGTGSLACLILILTTHRPSSQHNDTLCVHAARNNRGISIFTVVQYVSSHPGVWCGVCPGSVFADGTKNTCITH